jgi:hypothetical protein
MRRVLVLLMLLGCAGAQVGCEFFGAAAAPFDLRIEKAEFTLEPRPTAIIVDEAQGKADSRPFINQTAASVGYFLTENTALPPELIISPEKLTALREELGERYGSIAIDDLGRRLGAEQVIYVEVAEAVIANQPGIIQPRSLVGVRLVDATNGRRLYPTDDRSIGSRSAGRLVNTELPPTPAGEASLPAKQRALADETAQNVARLFYDWKRPAPGETIEAKRKEHAR